ncbi:MAG: ATP-binding protein, partial [Aquabacterium sp.]
AWLQQRGSGLWVVRGEAGVGKTRLVVHAGAGHGLEACWVRCREDLRNAPFQALIDLLGELPLPDVAALLPLAADRRDLARLLPALAPDEVLGPADGGAQRLVDVLATVVTGLAQTQPLVIDDLQWADPQLLEVLQRCLMKTGAGRGVRLLATLRPLQAGDTLQRWLDGLDVMGVLQQRALSPLPAQALDALLARLSGQQAPRFAAWLHQRSGGNPFFALETLRALFESGQLAPGERGWRSDLDALSADDAELQVPPRVAALVRQRLSSLSEAAQRVLMVVAVAGDAQALDAVAEGAGLSAWATAAAVAEGQAAGLLQGRRFAHDLVREALLAGTPEPLRAVLHAGLARRLADVLPPHRLAAHWWAAGDEPAAVQATLAAARLDADRGLHDAAEDRLAHAHGRTTDSALQARIDVARAAVARQSGRPADALALAQAALAALPLPDTRRDALLELYELRVLDGDLDAAEQWLGQARALGDESPALLMAAGKLAHARGDYPGATPHLEQLVAQLRRQRPGAELAAALTSLATTWDSQGELARGLPLHEEAMVIAHRLGARYVEVEAAGNRVWSLDELNRLDEAITVGELAMALGEYDATPYLLSNLAYVYLRVQRLDDAERAYRRLSDSGDASIACVACGKLADVAARRGDAAAVQAAVQAALGWLPRTQIYTAQVSALIAVLRHGDDAQARAALRHRRDQAVDPGLQQRLDDALHGRGLV